MYLKQCPHVGRQEWHIASWWQKLHAACLHCLVLKSDFVCFERCMAALSPLIPVCFRQAELLYVR